MWFQIPVSYTHLMSELTEVFSKRQQQFIQFAYSYVRDKEEAEDIVCLLYTSICGKSMTKTIANMAAMAISGYRYRCPFGFRCIFESSEKRVISHNIRSFKKRSLFSALLSVPVSYTHLKQCQKQIKASLTHYCASVRWRER